MRAQSRGSRLFSCQAKACRAKSLAWVQEDQVIDISRKEKACEKKEQFTPEHKAQTVISSAFWTN